MQTSNPDPPININFCVHVQPEFWPAGLGGYNETGDWKPGFAAYTQWFDRVARSLNPCGTPAFLSGPGWGEFVLLADCAFVCGFC
jgi:hypothetical protein